MNTKAKIGIGALAIVLVIVLLTEGVLIPKQLQPNLLPLRFKEFRDDTTLTAVFEIDNEADSPIVVWESATLVTHRDKQNSEEEITIQRTVVPKGQSGTLAVSVPRDCAWQVAFRVARFGPRQQRSFEDGRPVEGTIVYSDVVPQYEPNR